MFNPLNHQVTFSYPLRLSATAWAGHIPFAMFLVDLLRPGVIVELGAFSGVSFCAFCQAVKELGLEARAYAIDTWEGDPQSGHYGSEILRDLRQYHDPLYGEFSTLIQSTFDDALHHFTDGTVDLLHIDGYHTYDAVKHDFNNWLPKMSRRGVILFHDTNVRQGDFGVWKLWEEIKLSYPHFEFFHEHGLGVLAVGPAYPDSLRQIVELSEAERAQIRQFFFQLGDRLTAGLDREHEIKSLSWQVNDKEQIITNLTAQLRQKEEAVDWLQEKNVEKAEIVAAHEEAISQLAAQLQDKERAREELALSVAELQNSLDQIPAILSDQLPPDLQTARAIEGQLPADSLSAQLARQSEKIRALVIQASEWQSRMAALSKALADERAGLPKLEMELAEKEQAARQMAAQLAEKAKIEVAYQSLKNELLEYQTKARRLIATNHLLKAQANEKEDARRMLALQLAAKEAQLERMTRTLGWRLLSLYGPIKYRYLLPVYRWFGRLGETPNGQPSPVAATSEHLPAPVAFDLIDEEVAPEPIGAEWSEPETAAEDQRMAPAGFYDALTLLPRPREEELQEILKERPPESPRRHPDVICFSIDDGQVHHQRMPRTIAQFAAEGHRVFYLSATPFQPSEASPRVRVGILGENLYEVQLAAESQTNVADDGIEGKHQAALLQSVDELRHAFHIDEAIGYVMTPAWGAVALEAQKRWRWRLVYDCPGEREKLPEIAGPLPDIELRLVQRCDCLVVASQDLYEKWKEYNPAIVLISEAGGHHSYKEPYERIVAGLAEAIPRASLIIVTYNNLALNKLCLESIIRNTEYPNYEVIVVDNHSSDGTPAYLSDLAARHRHIHVILNSTNDSFARANNQGIARSTGQYIVLLNNDTVVPPGWLSRLLRHLQNPAVGLVGPVTNFVGNEARIDVPYRTLGEMEVFAREHTWAHDGQEADIPMLAMFCVAFKRDTYEAIGPLDEQFGIGLFEDDDYSHRMKAAGYRIICAADVFVHHFGQATFKKLIERGEFNRLFDENRRRYENKWNVRWTPHHNEPLRFESLTSS
jgi:GT2 family glycosyltransferase